MGTIIKAGWMIDGTGSPAIQNPYIIISNKTILNIKLNADSACNERVKDLSKYTILPGLMDSHVHLAMSGTNDAKVRSFQLSADFEEIKPAIANHLSRDLSCGVVGVRDGGGGMGHVLKYMDHPLEPGFPVFVKKTGRAWHKKGRYGKMMGRAPSGDLSQAISRDDEKKDHVKIINSGLNSLEHFARKTPPQFDINEMTAAVKACNKKGLYAMVHANGSLPVCISIESGCRSIEHGFFMGRDNLLKMADKGVFWVPTACTMKAYLQLVGPETSKAYVIQKNLEHQMEQIRLARDAGVLIALGTDSGSPGVNHGTAVAEEMKILVQAGYSMEEAVRCCTWNNALLLGADKKMGRLAKGMAATFIAVKGPPSRILENLKSIQYVYIDGEVGYEKN